MKTLIKVSVLSVLMSMVFGCASTYDTFVPPPEEINQAFMEYQKLPGQKVFVVAIDPTGPYAFGFDAGRATLEEAGKNAAVTCDQHREKNQVLNTAKVFAINDEVVYYKNLKKSK